ncbi:MAG: CRISPR-associated protein Cmr3 [Oscillochloris sp.]|nr:CRISPR-associated protein Cmr3 [Oscillochloris sp.]
MTTWIIEPRDPLIVRDGRPFGPNPGVRAHSLSFPFPSTTTGALRTQVGLNQSGIFSQTKEQLKDLKNIPVRGPLLVEWNDNEECWDYLAPAPADALFFEANERPAAIRQLVPLKLQEGEATDLPEELLYLVGLRQADPRKPKKDAPAFWRWKHFQSWLTNPQDELSIPEDLGHSGPTRESRIHIKFDAGRGTGEDGKLFETSGLEFTHGGKDRQALSAARQLALAIACEHEILHHQPVDTLGGERRIVAWQRSTRPLPTIPDGLAEQIVRNKHCRLILLTPAYFKEGYHPTWLREARNGVQATPVAAAVSRPQVVSGWDYDKKQPKATRRLAPAGSVYFLRLEGTEDAIRVWIERTWMQCVSDEDQAQRDGFGLAVLGSWINTTEDSHETA